MVDVDNALALDKGSPLVFFLGHQVAGPTRQTVHATVRMLWRWSMEAIGLPSTSTSPFSLYVSAFVRQQTGHA